MTDPFVLALIERQEREGLGSNEFARKLGVSPTYWSRARRGDREVGRPLIRGALAAYPDLAPLLVPKVTISTVDRAN